MLTSVHFASQCSVEVVMSIIIFLIFTTSHALVNTLVWINISRTQRTSLRKWQLHSTTWERSIRLFSTFVSWQKLTPTGINIFASFMNCDADLLIRPQTSILPNYSYLNICLMALFHSLCQLSINLQLCFDSLKRRLQFKIQIVVTVNALYKMNFYIALWNLFYGVELFKVFN